MKNSKGPRILTPDNTRSKLEGLPDKDILGSAYLNKPEPNMLPTIPSSTFQKIHLHCISLILFSYHYLLYPLLVIIWKQ